jgi:hypothetical protein
MRLEEALATNRAEGAAIEVALNERKNQLRRDGEIY